MDGWSTVYVLGSIIGHMHCYATFHRSTAIQNSSVSLHLAHHILTLYFSSLTARGGGALLACLLACVPTWFFCIYNRLCLLRALYKKNRRLNETHYLLKEKIIAIFLGIIIAN